MVKVAIPAIWWGDLGVFTVFGRGEDKNIVIKGIRLER